MIKKNNSFYNDKKTSKKYLLKDGLIIDVVNKKILKEDLYIKNKIIEKIDGKIELDKSDLAFILDLSDRKEIDRIFKKAYELKTDFVGKKS